MDQRQESTDSQAEGTEGTLRELALKWFTETQAPLILHNGNFPDWFQGFIARKDAEETLRAKELGCFLIRLSDKAIGYILSYKGRDRCRHFVINQNKSGQFIVSGDTEMHDTLTDLIEYYKTSPIEPFGEYLTCSCLESSTAELYDIIQVIPKEKPVVCVKAVRSMWDQQSARAVEQPPTLPPKSSRKPEEVPPVPRRGGPLKNDSLDAQSRTQSKVLYAQLEQHRARDRAKPRAQQSSLETLHKGPAGGAEGPISQHGHRNRRSPAPGPGPVCSDNNLLDCRSKSLPLLDNNSEDEEPSYYRLSASSFTPPRLSPNPPRQATRHTAPLLEQEEDPSRGPTSTSGYSLDQLCPVYHLAGRASPHHPAEEKGSKASAEENDYTYAEVSCETLPRRFLLDNTYEQIPEQGGATRPLENNNTYETLDALKPRHAFSSWGLKNDKWRWLFPENKKK